MTYLAALLFGLAVSSVVWLVARLIPARPRSVTRQLAELERIGNQTVDSDRRQRQRHSRDLKEMLEIVGGRFGGDPRRRAQLRELLIHAGYREAGAAGIYWGTRIALTVGLGFGLLVLVKLLGADMPRTLIAGAWGAVLGWVVPAVHRRPEGPPPAEGDAARAPRRAGPAGRLRRGGTGPQPGAACAWPRRSAMSARLTSEQITLVNLRDPRRHRRARRRCATWPSAPASRTSAR